MFGTTIVASLLIIAVIVRWLLRVYRRRTPWRVRSARRALEKVRSFTGEFAHQQCFTYLRKLDPFVFEELVLLCFGERGFRVQRSPYTRDGGIDGTVWFEAQQPILIQSKRYAKHIHAQHVRDFTVLLERRKKAGLFVHTGRTGRASRREVQGTPMQIISGARLLKLIYGEPLLLLDHQLPGSRR